MRKDYLRIQVVVETISKDYSYIISALKEYYTGKQGFKLDIIDKRERAQKEATEEKVNKLLSDYDFLFDKQLPIGVKIHKFIKRKYQKDISEERIIDLLGLQNK